jgi:protein-L-isoaspartate(D-aspartate) O-methyltransferase
MQDVDHASERMIREQVVDRGIVDTRVIEAMRQTPRDRFVEREQLAEAFDDRALPMTQGQAMSQPYIVALMAQAAAIQPTDRVLEIGAGSGYGAAILGRLAARVWTIERVPQLARRAGVIISELGLSNITVLRGDGTLGWAPAAPFDAIVVTAAAPETLDALRNQLAIGGRLIMPVGLKDGPQRLVKVVRKGPAAFEQEDLGPVSFVPLIGEHAFKMA